MEPRLTEINRNEVLLYLGYRGGELPPDTEAQIERCAALMERTVRPRAVWRVFPLDGEGVPAGTDFRPAGQDVKRLLADCRAMVLFAATLGTEAERLIRRAQVTDMAEAVVLDACGSAAIENVCDNLCADLETELAPDHLTDRFSPGYGDMPFGQQQALCRLLDVGRRIGVTLTPGGLMLPQKSVTALMGVSHAPAEKRGKGCAACSLFRTCAYRKDGESCGK